MRYFILILIVALSSCSQTELDSVEPIKKPKENNKAATVLSPFEGIYYKQPTVINQWPNHPLHLMPNKLHFRPIGRNAVILNGSDTLDIVNPNEAIGRVPHKLQRALLVGSEIHYTQFVPDHSQQMTFLMTSLYTRSLPPQILEE